MAGNVMHGANWISAADLLRAMPSRMPETVADKAANKMMTGGGKAPLPTRQVQQGPAFCGSCGKSHRLGNACDKSMNLERAFEILFQKGVTRSGNKKGNPFHDDSTGKFTSSQSASSAHESGEVGDPKPRTKAESAAVQSGQSIHDVRAGKKQEEIKPEQPAPHAPVGEASPPAGAEAGTSPKGPKGAAKPAPAPAAGGGTNVPVEDVVSGKPGKRRMSPEERAAGFAEVQAAMPMRVADKVYNEKHSEALAQGHSPEVAHQVASWHASDALDAEVSRRQQAAGTAGELADTPARQSLAQTVASVSGGTPPTTSPEHAAKLEAEWFDAPDAAPAALATPSRTGAGTQPAMPAPKSPTQEATAALQAMPKPASTTTAPPPQPAQAGYVSPSQAMVPVSSKQPEVVRGELVEPHEVPGYQQPQLPGGGGIIPRPSQQPEMSGMKPGRQRIPVDIQVEQPAQLPGRGGAMVDRPSTAGTTGGAQADAGTSSTGMVTGGGRRTPGGGVSIAPPGGGAPGQPGGGQGGGARAGGRRGQQNTLLEQLLNPWLAQGGAIGSGMFTPGGGVTPVGAALQGSTYGLMNYMTGNPQQGTTAGGNPKPPGGTGGVAAPKIPRVKSSQSRLQSTP